MNGLTGMIILHDKESNLVYIARSEVAMIQQRRYLEPGWGYRTISLVTLKNGDTIEVKEDPRTVFDEYMDD